MFRAELGGPDGMLTPRETAAAVSAALLHRRDARLFEAAEKGQLTNRAQLAEHIRRMLDDPKLAKPRLLGFFREYFEYGQAPEVFKDRPKDLMHEPKQHVADTDRLILHLVTEDKDVFRQLLTTPLAYVNVKQQRNKQKGIEELAPAVTKNPNNNKGQEIIETLYGLKEWPTQQPITQAPGGRIGVLMQPSWLIAWSENFNNDIAISMLVGALRARLATRAEVARLAVPGASAVAVRTGCSPRRNARNRPAAIVAMNQTQTASAGRPRSAAICSGTLCRQRFLIGVDSATWPRAWQPASVRPAPVTVTGSFRISPSWVSRTPCTVRLPG